MPSNRKNLEGGGQDHLLALYAAVFGVWLFLMCWEASPRYFSNFAPVIVTCGVLGVPPVTRRK